MKTLTITLTIDGETETFQMEVKRFGLPGANQLKFWIHAIRWMIDAHYNR